MSEQPKFLRDFSKNEHAKERNEMAAQIREARVERTSLLSENAEKVMATYQ